MGLGDPVLDLFLTCSCSCTAKSPKTRIDLMRRPERERTRFAGEARNALSRVPFSAPSHFGIYCSGGWAAV
jgi:hypothetical protein